MTVLLSVTTALLGAQAPNSSNGRGLPSDDDIRQILRQRVDAQGKGVGIVVGVIDASGARVVSYGQIAEGDQRPLDGDTAFEIGSMTKVFTALALADMVRRGEVALEDPIAKYLPAGARVPERDGQPITFLEVATHTSGLQLMPDGLTSLNELVTLKYSDVQLYSFLAQFEVPHQDGLKWGYSNIGYSLLGKALAARAGVGYGTLLRTRLFVPLELHNTGVMAEGLRAKLAVGHDASLQPTPPLSTVPMLHVMAPAGAVLSTANDLLRLLRVAMGYERSPLAPAMAAMLSTRRPSPVGEQALGWMVEGKGDDQLVFHDGGTFRICQFNGVGSEEACRGCRALQSRRTRWRHSASPAAAQPSSGEARRHEAHRDRPRLGGPRQLRWPIYLRGRRIHHHEGRRLPDDSAAS